MAKKGQRPLSPSAAETVMPHPTLAFSFERMVVEHAARRRGSATDAACLAACKMIVGGMGAFTLALQAGHPQEDVLKVIKAITDDIAAYHDVLAGGGTIEDALKALSRQHNEVR